MFSCSGVSLPRSRAGITFLSFQACTSLTPTYPRGNHRPFAIRRWPDRCDDPFGGLALPRTMIGSMNAARLRVGLFTARGTRETHVAHRRSKEYNDYLTARIGSRDCAAVFRNVLRFRMLDVRLSIPEESLLALKVGPDQIGSELRLVAAVKLYELKRLSSGAAAKLAGIPRTLFLMKLGEYGVDTFDVTSEDMARETPLA